MKYILTSMVVGLCMEKFNDNNGGGGGAGALPEADFQKKVFETLDSNKNEMTKVQTFAQEQNEKLLKQLEDIKNKNEGSLEDVQQLDKIVRKMQLNAAVSQRKAYGDPIQSMLADPEKKTLINALIRKAIDAPLSESHTKALSSAGTTGGSFIDDELFTDVYDTLSSYGIWSSFDVRNVNTLNSKFLVKTARPIAKVFGEGITITEDNSKAGVSVTQEARGIKVLLTVPNELLADAEIDLSQDIMIDFLEAVAFRMDFMCLQADGANDDLAGGMTGIFSGGTAAVAAAGHTTIETLELEDVTATLLAADEAAMGRNACWWIHPHILVRLLHIKDENGRPIFLTANEAPAPGAIGSILGFPVKLSPAAPNSNAAGQPVAVFGDPAGMVCGLRKSFDFMSSKEAAFNDDETVFRGVARFGNKIRSASAFGVLTLAAS